LRIFPDIPHYQPRKREDDEGPGNRRRRFYRK
jgi:hypothetical protein